MIKMIQFKQKPIGKIIEEWKVVRLGDKGHFQYGYTTSAIEEDTGTKFLRITDIKEDGAVNWGTVPYGIIDDESLQKFRLSEGDVLFTRIGATTGKTGIIEGVIPNAVFASYLIRFVPNKELQPKYVFYFTQTREYQELVNARKEGKLKKGLSATELKNFKIPLPPLPEQRAIAKVLSTVQDAKEKTDAVITATKELKKSLMKHLFTYGPVSVEEAANVPLKETEVGLVPEEWDVERLGEVAKVKYGKAKTKDSGNIPVVGSGGIYSTTNKALVEYPTIVIGRKGTAGKVWLFLESCYPSDTTFYLKWKKDIDVSFLFNYMSLNPLSGEHAKTTLPSLQKPDLENLLIPYPSLPEQQKIASILSAVDEKIEKEETKKKALEELFKSLLNNLMTGKLRVNHLEV